MAEKIDVNFQTVGYLEREEYNPSLDLAFRISEVFKKPVDFIFSTEPMMPLSQNVFENMKNGLLDTNATHSLEDRFNG